MENLELRDLIKEVKNTTDVTSDMLNSMLELQSVLEKFNATYTDIQNVGKKLQNTDIINGLKEITNTFNNSISNIDEINTIISDTNIKVLKTNQEFSYKKEEFDKIENKFNSYMNTVDNITDILNKINEKVFDLDNQIENQLGTNFHKLYEKFDILDKKINDINLNKVINKLDLVISKEAQFEEQLNIKEKTIAKYTEKIEESSKNVIDSENNLSGKVKTLIESNQEINSVLEGLNSNNKDMINVFNRMVDEWASNNIHGIAIKKKKNN